MQKRIDTEGLNKEKNTSSKGGQYFQGWGIMPQFFRYIDIRALYSRTARKGVMILPDPAAGETCDTHSHDGQTP